MAEPHPSAPTTTYDTPTPRVVTLLTDAGRPVVAAWVMIMCAPGEHHLGKLAASGPRCPRQDLRCPRRVAVPGDRHHLMEATLGATHHLREFLADLPIPVVVPSLVTEGEQAREAFLSLNRARTLIDDEPISDAAKAAHKDLILKWLTAYEMVVLLEIAGPAPWRLDLVEYALARSTALSMVITSGEAEELDES